MQKTISKAPSSVKHIVQIHFFSNVLNNNEKIK